MASPFKSFRKNQKIMMAVITILSMFAFLAFGPWTRLGDPTNAYKNPEVFTWKYGTVTQDDINSAIMARRGVQNFLFLLSREIGRSDRDTDQLLRMQFAPPSEGSVIQTMLLAKKAEQMGINVSDDMIKNYLSDWTDHRPVSSEKISQLLGSVPVADRKSRGPRQLKQSELFETLRTDLAAMYGRYMFFPLFTRTNYYSASFAGDTPADRWKYFCQVNRKATTQILPIAVADYVSEIADPSDSTLREFYEQHKNQVSSPENPTPGFYQPYKAQFQYFKADYAKLLAEEKPKVTEQEIKDYYETNKDRDFRKSHFSEPAGGAENATSDKTGIDSTSAKPDESVPPAATEQPNKQSAPDSSAADRNPANGKATDGVKPTPAETAVPKTDANSPAEGKKSSQTPNVPVNGELLAFADEALLAQATPATKDEEKPSADNKSQTTQTETKSTEQQVPTAETQSAESKPAGTGADVAPPTTIPTIEYEPLEKVSDQIRDRIAAQKVDSRIDRAFTALFEKMKKYSSELGRSRVKLAESPKPLDFKSLAQEFSIDAVETDLITARQAFDGTDIGKSRAMLSLSNPQPPTFIDSAFNSKPALPTFDPKESEDNDRNRYLWWKTADAAPHTPPLADIKAEVVKAWKMIEARKPAKIKAEKLAEDVRKSNLPIREALTGMKNAEDVITAGPFSWLEQNYNQAMQLSKVSGVTYPGPDFMKTVFSLEPKQAGVTHNLPEDTYYVVQVESVEPSLDELENSFMSAMANPNFAQKYAMVGAQEHYYDDRAWFKELQQQFNVKFAPRTAVTEESETADGE